MSTMVAKITSTMLFVSKRLITRDDREKQTHVRFSKNIRGVEMYVSVYKEGNLKPYYDRKPQLD